MKWQCFTNDDDTTAAMLSLRETISPGSSQPFNHSSSSESVSMSASGAFAGAAFACRVNGRCRGAGGCSPAFLAGGGTFGVGLELPPALVPASSSSSSSSSFSLAVDAVSSAVSSLSVSWGSVLILSRSKSSSSSASSASRRGDSIFRFRGLDGAGARDDSGSTVWENLCDADWLFWKEPVARIFCCSRILTFFSLRRSLNFMSSAVSSSCFDVTSSSSCALSSFTVLSSSFARVVASARASLLCVSASIESAHHSKSSMPSF